MLLGWTRLCGPEERAAVQGDRAGARGAERYAGPEETEVLFIGRAVARSGSPGDYRSRPRRRHAWINRPETKKVTHEIRIRNVSPDVGREGAVDLARLPNAMSIPPTLPSTSWSRFQAAKSCGASSNSRSTGVVLAFELRGARGVSTACGCGLRIDQG
jgi:hypothetical protein